MLGREAFAVFCTAEVPTSLLSKILEATYAEGPDSPPALLIVKDASTIAEAGPDPELSHPPVTAAPSGAFHGWHMDRLATFLRKTENDAFSKRHFLVADAQTADDQTLLLVETGAADDLHTVRLAASQANASVTAISVGSMGINELRSNTDSDEIYRGGSGPPPVKGQPAPKKQLGGQH